MAKLDDMVAWMDSELRLGEIPDYPQALNGLQLENSGEVRKVASAVDASLPVIRKAIAEGVDLLVVHHGLFWQGAQRIVGGQYFKYSEAIKAGLAIYSAHIPLDVHPSMGNNALLCELIGMDSAQPFHDWKGVNIGLRQKMEMSLESLIGRVEAATGHPCHHCRGYGENVGMVGVITGGAGSEVAAMAAEGINTFITGEGPHWSYLLAEELGVNVIYGGHYATEIFGVRSLVKNVCETFGLPFVFLDHPTGL